MLPVIVFSLSLTSSFAQKIQLVGQLKYDHNLSSIWGYTAPDGDEYALVGTYNGTSIVDISVPENPEQIHWIEGPHGYWREIKTWKDYAYIVHDNSSAETGITIVDLRNIKTGIPTKNFRGPNNDIIRGHTLYIDEAGFLYLFGGTKQGCYIFDLNSDPLNPVYKGFTSTEYIHDGFVRNDTLWASNIYQGYISVWNVSNKAAPVKITQFFTPGRFSHNSWLSDDSKTLFTTDEKTATTIAAFDVSDLTDIQLLEEFKIRPDEQSIPHNVHVIDDYLVVSHYTEGVLIADASVPENIVEIDKFDTSPNFSGDGFNGCWGVFPYFPSGLIIASDIEDGLYVLRPDYKRASRFFGKVYDLNTSEPINGATVSLSNSEKLSRTNFDGTYKTGAISSGTITLTAKSPDYQDKSVSFEVTEGENIEYDFYLLPYATNVNQQTTLVRSIRTSPEKVMLTLEKTYEPYHVSIFNAQGQIVIKSRSFTTQEYEADWSILPAGVYFIQVSTSKYSHANKVYKN